MRNGCRLVEWAGMGWYVHSCIYVHAHCETATSSSIGEGKRYNLMPMRNTKNMVLMTSHDCHNMSQRFHDWLQLGPGIEAQVARGAQVV